MRVRYFPNEAMLACVYLGGSNVEAWKLTDGGFSVCVYDTAELDVAVDEYACRSRLGTLATMLRVALALRLGIPIRWQRRYARFCRACR